MAFYIRKAVKAGPFRFNLSKSGIGVSTGVPGFRVGSGPRGNYGLFRLSRGGAVWHWMALAVIGGCRPTVPGGVDSLVF
ncbi:MAG: DUF4236 domain-containing protein [Mycobacterium sp.]